MSGYIKLWRRLLDDPLWTQVPTAWLRVALAILLLATWKAAKWFDGVQEIELPAGSLVTSRPSMCKQARVTSQQYRDALSYLEKTGFSTSKRTSRYTVITVCNWARYQGDSENENQVENEERTSKEPTKNQPRTTSEEVKKGRRQERKKTETQTDSDCPATNHKNRDSRPGGVVASQLTQYPKLKDILTKFMGETPTDRFLVDLVHVCAVTEYEVAKWVAYLWNERKIQPGSEYFPKSFKWFLTAGQEHFEAWRARAEVASPKGSDHWSSDGTERIDGFDTLDGGQ